MADEQATQVTTDQAGINRTTDGQITTAAATETQQQTTIQSKSDSQDQSTTQTSDTTDDGKTLLSEKKQEAAPEGAPEKYADYSVPEGFALDPEVKVEADKIFKSMNLSQAQAQELVNFYTAKTREAFEAPFNAYQDTRKEWRSAAENDPDLKGKLGPGRDVNVTIGKMLASLNDPKLVSDFQEAYDITGFGDHPAFIKVMYRMAQRLTEGSSVSGRGPSAHGQQRPGSEAARSAAQDLWPNLPSSARG